MTTGRVVIVVGIAILVAVAAAAARPLRFVVDGLSMAPGLMPGDVVTTGWMPGLDRLRTPRRFETWVVATPEGEAAIKRIVGLPGERLSICDGDLVVDDAVVAKSPEQFRATVHHARLNAVVEPHRVRLPPGEALDDADFAAEVSRPLDVVRDVGLAAIVLTGSESSRCQATVGGRRVSWRLPARSRVWVVAGRLDGLLVAAAWRDRGSRPSDGGAQPLPHRVPESWTAAEPWADDATDGVVLDIEPPARLDQALPWRDIHLRPEQAGDSLSLGDGFFLLGDFPSGSVDSRTWGPLARDALVHRVAP